MSLHEDVVQLKVVQSKKSYREKVTSERREPEQMVAKRWEKGRSKQDNANERLVSLAGSFIALPPRADRIFYLCPATWAFCMQFLGPCPYCFRHRPGACLGSCSFHVGGRVQYR